MNQFQHIRSQEFVALENKLPVVIRSIVAKQFQHLRTNQSHPSLRFKKVSDRWSLRITHNYRALEYRHNNLITWYWVGTHAEYERQITKPL